MKQEERYRIINGDSLKILDTFAANSIDACITDPPYELGFMNKAWDGSGIAYNIDLWKKVYNVLKPGAYLLAFGGTRTYHRMACAIEDAGFEIRDCIMWLYGSGFPKSMAVDRAIEGKLTIGSSNTKDFKKLNGELEDKSGLGWAKNQFEQGIRPTNYNENGQQRLSVLKPTTEEAKKWSGWGTSLKPSYEPIIVARKPIEKSVADNILKYGVGAINIDECRVGDDLIKGGTMPDLDDVGKKQKALGNGHIQSFGQISNAKRIECEDHYGRFPANTILTYDKTDFEEVCGGMPNTKSTITPNDSRKNVGNSMFIDGVHNPNNSYDDEGSAARYFYCAKASKKDKDNGLIKFEEKMCFSALNTKNGTGKRLDGRDTPMRKNIHPTVKPVELMQYLIRLVSPKGATILDIFNGSGSTGKAVAFENRERNADYKYIGIELDPNYCEISKGRIDYAVNKYQYDILEEVKEHKEKGQLTLFDFEDL